MFQRAEEYSTLWAATALSPGPVINRPGKRGAIGRMTWGAIASALNIQSDASMREIFTSGPEQVAASDDVMWGEDVNYISAPIGAFQNRVPLRARKVNPNALYEIITIVGARGFPATADPLTAEFGLVRKSLALAFKVNVHFATVTWAIDDLGASPVRLNAEPEEPDLQYAWHEVGAALCEDLMG
jgi:hypothetical protein